MAIVYRDRLKRRRERRAFGLSEGGGKRFGPWYLIRVFLLILATIILTWYAKLGVNNPFATVKSIRVYGDGGGYAVAAVAAGFRKDGVVLSEAAVSGGVVGVPRSADSSGAAAWREVYPFADGDSGGARAALLTYDGVTALVCGSSVYGRPAEGVSTRFREKLDLLVVPPAGGAELLGARDRFRPRFVVAAPPCTSASARNVLCAAPDENGRWGYTFTMKTGKLELDTASVKH
jgi:hypothetical protein